VNVDEIVKYGGLSVEQAQQVDQLWEELIREYLTLSPRSEWITTTHASHSIHTTEPELLLSVVQTMLAQL
jgi:hypothetical protein